MKNRILRRPEVESCIGLSRAHIYQMIAKGDFPSPIKIGRRAVGWIEADISAWLEQKIEAAKREGRK